MSNSSVRIGLPAPASEIATEAFPTALCAIRDVVDPSCKLLDVERVRRVRDILHEMDERLAGASAGPPRRF